MNKFHNSPPPVVGYLRCRNKLHDSPIPILVRRSVIGEERSGRIIKQKRERLSSFPSVEGTGLFSNRFLNDLRLLVEMNFTDCE
jgi:ligand-binding sensor protein